MHEMHKVWVMAEVTDINRHLLSLRKRRKWKQEDAAAACGWDQPKISKLETGGQQPTIADLQIISRVFSVSFTHLIKLRARVRRAA